MDFKIGENIVLSRFITKNEKPELGLTVTVEVKDSLDGSEVLASTPAPEISLGLYSFNWTDPPQEEKDLCQIFSFQNRTSSKAFRIRRQVSGAVSGALDALVTENKLEGLVSEEKTSVEGQVTDKEKLEGTITENILSGTVSEDDNTFGEINENTLEGTVEGDC